MRFLVDECLPLDIGDTLIEEGHGCLHVLESALRSSADETLWRLAAEQGRIIVTADLDYPLAELPRPPGLILLRLPDTFSREQIAARFRQFVREGGLAAAEGSIVVIERDRVRSRRFDELDLRY